MDPDEQKQENGDPLLIVGLGASAGGLAALKTFFKHMPPDSGAAYVVVVHLSPDHKSLLADLLQPYSPIPVKQVAESMPLEPNHVYVIPPAANLETIDTHLRLSELERSPGDRATVDHFFRTLADTHDGHSVGVVLTGTGSDGTLGLRRIKEVGGLTIVQDPNEAEHDGMPRSAISAGYFDQVLPIEEIPAAIVRFQSTRPNLPVTDKTDELSQSDHRILHKIFAQLLDRAGHDFTRYKLSTILRRIQRRMQIRSIEDLTSYLEVLRDTPTEINDLFNDLLINVTEFFRDDDVFRLLQEKVVPALLEKKSVKERVRIWSVGCSTGEEAYSLAMLLVEACDGRTSAPAIQILASDLHEPSLKKAREGRYPEEIAVDVSTKRLNRFFDHENGQYTVKRELRELIVFAPHNLLRDPPFSHLDLVVCRNLLIYLQRDIQHDILALFHYALEPDGLLLLGASETADRSDLFTCEGKDERLYRKRNTPPKPFGEFAFPLVAGRTPELPWADKPSARPPRPEGYGSIHEKMAERYAPPSVLVNETHEIVHSSATAGRYLQVPPGGPSASLFKLARPPLPIELRDALRRVRESGKPYRSKPISVEIDGQFRKIVLRVQPASEPELVDFLLVIFDEVPESDEAGEENDKAEGSTTPASFELEEDLKIARQRLQGAVEEYETSREEMQASNEELQSANEELRSTLEELETSKEELQSMNEELITLNQENRLRVEELDQLSSDLQNHLCATDIATLFLDRELRIMRFTPRIGELFNIRPTDWGRPLSDLTHHLGYEGFERDARSVLADHVPIETEIQGPNENWYLTRVLPYRTAEDRVEGAVITFIDITARLTAQRELAAANEKLERRVDEQDRERRIILEHVPAYIAHVDSEMKVRFLNRNFQKDFGIDPEESVGKEVSELLDPAVWKEIAPRIERASKGEKTQFETTLNSPAGPRILEIRCVPRREAKEAKEAKKVGVILLGRDITVERRVQQEIGEAIEKEKEQFSRDLHDSICQELGAVAMFGRALASEIEGKDAAGAEEARKLVAKITDINSRTRKLARGLSPVVLENCTFPEALAELASITNSSRDGVECEVIDRLKEIKLDDATATQMFFIAREAVTNAMRHGEPSLISIELANEDEHFVMTVTDDGGGSRKGMAEGIGIRSMRHRARTLGGELMIKNNPAANGIEVLCRLKHGQG